MCVDYIRAVKAQAMHGGITSAAMDGIRAAEWIAARFCPRYYVARLLDRQLTPQA